MALAAGAGAQTDALPGNIAPLATGLWAESEHSAPYALRYAVDGIVPGPGSCDDAHRAWAVDGTTHAGGCRVRFEWDEPQTVGEVVYYGRTAWLAEECWKDWAVYIDAASEPVARGQFLRGHGPQRVTLPEPVPCSVLTIQFTGSWGGMNAGASEIQIFPSPVAMDLLPEFIELPPGRPSVFLPHDSPLDKQVQALPASRALETDLIEGRLGFNSLVLVKRRRLMPSHVYTYHNEGFEPGGGLYVFSPQGGETGRLERLVDSPDGQILDADLSYDGETILFSWRRDAGEVYQLYTVRSDGSGFAQLTDNPWHTFNACWLPDGDIAFLAAPESAYAYCWTSPVGILHRMRPDGTDVVKLSANYLNDFTPNVMNDGQIVYGRWEYVDRPAIPIQGLWTINPDGTGLEQFYGNRVLSPATFIEPRAIPGSPNVLCILTAHNGPCRGAVGIIDPRKGVNAQASIRNLTPEVDIGKVNEGSGNHIVGPYENPYPLDGELFVVSRDGTVLLRDYDHTRQVVLIRPVDGMGFYAPQPVRPEPVPPVRASALPPDPEPLATLFLQDVYRGLEPHVQRGEIRRLAVVQEIEKSQLADLNQRSFGFQFPTVSCGATYAPKRVLGTATVEADGSACFRVPASLPIYFMALDAEGRALQRMRSFTHLMPGETQGCIGCHEPRSHTAAMSGTPLAFGRPPEDLTPPEWGDRGFSYPHIVQPVLDRHCVACHNPEAPAGGIDLVGDRTDFFNVSYEYLARLGTVGMDPEMGGIPRPEDTFSFNPYTRWIYTYNGAEQNILMIEPRQWGSPASRLSDLVISGHADADGHPRVALSEAERRRIHTWIDLNVPYYGTSKFNYPERLGCRRQYPEELDAVLQEVGQRRCVGCHGRDEAGLVRIPRDFFVRVTRPEHNAFLRAPLAAAAGGSQACGEAVFASTEDPDYQAILATFRDVLEELQRRPRMDMVEDPAAAEQVRAGIGSLRSASMSALTAAILGTATGHAEPRIGSPTAVVGAGGRWYVAAAAGHAILEVDPDTGTVTPLASLPEAPNGLVHDPDKNLLYATCDSPEGRVCVIDLAHREKVAEWFSGGHTPSAPQLAAGSLLALCNRFSGTVSLMDTHTGTVTATVAVGREPVAAAVSPDGRELWVAHLLPEGPADGPVMAASVSLVDVAERRVAARIALPNGSTSARGLTLSPDGAHAYVTHIVSRFHLPTTQVVRGWMNTNALSVIDTRARSRTGTVLLDELDRGAANPWGVACAPSGQTLFVCLSGTHELALIDLPALHARLREAPEGIEEDLTFLDGIRRRVALPGNGPRGLAVLDDRACAAAYFSDSLAILDADARAGERVSSIALGSEQPQTAQRLGERYFHDAAFCFQQWQSCATCHPDARADALNWDLLNDGIGNPKNTRSMLYSHETPPVMGHGVRASAEVAVRAGIKFIQFAVRPEEDAAAIDAYLRALVPVPSPWLQHGEPGEAARRGEVLFHDQTVGCAECHPGPHYTDLKRYDVGTRGPLDYTSPEFDTPALVEVWRTAPYLHDGRSATMREVLREHNPDDRHGVTSHLTDEEMDDLAAYVLSR